jgi:hypothetical protein
MSFLGQEVQQQHTEVMYSYTIHADAETEVSGSIPKGVRALFLMGVFPELSQATYGLAAVDLFDNWVY